MISFDPFVCLAVWSDRFSRRDSIGLAAIYHERALLFGSSDSLLSGRAAIQRYFAALPATGPASARFSDIECAPLSASTVAVAGLVHFSIGESTLTMRITLSLVEEGGAWLIGLHHAAMPGMLPGNQGRITQNTPK